MNVPAPNAQQQALERAIHEHLDAHPHAADSAEGVARWWLGSRAAAGAVERALGELVARGLLRRVSLPDGKTLYSKKWSHPHQ